MLAVMGLLVLGLLASDEIISRFCAAPQSGYFMQTGTNKIPAIRVRGAP